MNGKEDFGPLVDALVACVGAMDVISVVGLVYNLANYSSLPMDINNNNDVKVMQDKSQHEDLSRSKSNNIPLLVVDNSKIDSGADVIDSLVSKVNDLHEKVSELVIRSRENSIERFLDVERERYRRSRSPSPLNRDEEYANSFLEQENGDTEYDHHPSRSITRDDEFRKTIKRSSQVSSQHETREEELARLTELEAEEMNNMDDYVPLTYQSDENDDNVIETIEETPTCPIHGKIEEILASGGMDNEKATEILAEDAKSHDKNKIQEELDINENFIKTEKAALQQQSSTARLLIKQGNVGSEDFPEETLNEMKAQKSESIMTEMKMVENILTQATIEQLPKLENFPKSQEIKSSANETSTEFITAFDESQNVNSSTVIEEFSKAQTQSPIMVRSFAEILATNDIIDEKVTDLQVDEHLPVVEVISEPQSVIGSLMEVNINSASKFQNNSIGSTETPSLNSYSNLNLNVSTASLQNKSENVSLASSTFDNVEYLMNFYLTVLLLLIPQLFMIFFLGLCHKKKDTRTRCKYFHFTT
jgi:predicted DNA-binding transcriptional regulator